MAFEVPPVDAHPEVGVAAENRVGQRHGDGNTVDRFHRAFGVLRDAVVERANFALKLIELTRDLVDAGFRCRDALPKVGDVGRVRGDLRGVVRYLVLHIRDHWSRRY